MRQAGTQIVLDNYHVRFLVLAYIYSLVASDSCGMMDVQRAINLADMTTQVFASRQLFWMIDIGSVHDDRLRPVPGHGCVCLPKVGRKERHN